MAKVKLVMPDDFEKRLTSLGKNEDAIAEKVLEAGAEVVLPKVKSSLAGSIGRNTKVESRSTGELLGSLGVSPMNRDKDGNNNVVLNIKNSVKIYFYFYQFVFPDCSTL